MDLTGAPKLENRMPHHEEVNLSEGGCSTLSLPAPSPKCWACLQTRATLSALRGPLMCLSQLIFLSNPFSLPASLRRVPPKKKSVGHLPPGWLSLEHSPNALSPTCFPSSTVGPEGLVKRLSSSGEPGDGGLYMRKEHLTFLEKKPRLSVGKKRL